MDDEVLAHAREIADAAGLPVSADTEDCFAADPDGVAEFTARADNHFRGVDDLDDTITRLRAYAAAGADVVYAPGLRTREQIRAVLDAVDVPVNVLAMSGVPPVGELAALGVARVSVGAGFAMTAYSALLDAGRELQDGTYGFCDRAATGRAVVRDALS